MIVHGGGWGAGTRSMAPHGTDGSTRLAITCSTSNTALPPPERWKDAPGDVKCALGFVAANAAKYRVDPARISVKGDSAGGHLAMLAAYSMGHPDLPPSCDAPAVPIRSVINFYGPVDLVLGYDTSASLAYARRMLTQFIGGSPRAIPGALPRCVSR